MAGDALSAEEGAGLVRLVRGVFGGGCRIAECRVAMRRRDYLVALATLTDPALAVAIKLAGPDAPLACPFDRTAAFLRLVRERTTVPIPTVLACDVSYREFPWRYLITTMLPGVRWDVARLGWTAADQRDAWEALGRAVAQLHALRFPAFGEIGANGSVSDSGAYPAALAERARRRLADPGHLECFLSVLQAHATDFAAPTEPCLSHEDLNWTNLLLDRDERTGRWRLTGILDFDSAWAGNPESDLARLAFWDGMAGDEFWSGYGLTRSLTPQEHERRLVLQLLWCLEYAQATERHHADTRRICDALGIAPITFG